MPIYKRVQYNAPVILTYTLVSLAVLALGYATNGVTNAAFFSVQRLPLTDPLLYLRLFTHVLGHANVAHFFNNLVIILLIGPMLEEKYGAKWLGLMMLTTAFVTGLLFIIMVPGARLLGGSGLAFMLILLSSYTNLQKGRIPLTLILAFLIFIGREVFTGATAEGTNVSHLTHVIGGVCGAVFGYAVNALDRRKDASA